jgi:Cu+-exporting ATPase
MAGTNAAARRGILIRDGAALEKTGTLTAVVFDKTGTLTLGKVAVAAVEDLRAESDRQTPLAELAAALARPSNHPLSQAVARLSEKSRGAESEDAQARSSRGNETPSNPIRVSLVTSTATILQQWQEVRGSGVQARVLGGGTLRLGSLAWLRESGVELAAAEKFTDEWSAQGATLLGLASEQRLIGLLALRDELKPHAAEVVSRLARGGQKCFLITGDNRRTAAAVAAQAGISQVNVFAEIRPEAKADIVKQLQRRGERVAFIGDGINDAPALEQADLGIAVSRASDVAREAADVILLNSDIQAVPETLALARATLRTIKQNLFWAFFYNAAGIPLAALGFMSPVLCAAAMGFSDLIVIGNALRLRSWKK